MRFTEFRIIKEAANTNIVVVGDSIALGIGQAIKGAVVNATVGINSSKILSNISSDRSIQGAKLAIVSAGSNDIVKGKGDPQRLAANIAAIKDALNAEKYVWILPYDKVASAAVSKVVGGDKTVDLSSYSSSDGLHPSSYSAVATAARAGLNLSSNEPGAPRTKDKQGAGTKPTEVLAVPTGRQGPEVADVQKVLLALGYKLPTHGVDGIRGPETVAAVKEFQQANGLGVDGDPGPETIAAMNKVVANKGIKIEKSTQADVKAKVKTANTVGSAGIGPIGDHPKIEEAKSSADKFLGRKMDEAEWNELVRATSAEASSNTKECAFVMAVILNRTRKGYGGGNSVNDILHQKNQFQAVTGTRADGYSPSKWFIQGPSKGKLDMIVDGAINILPGAPKDIYRFTAASRAAYGPGTNVGYLDKLKADGGTQIGGTVFA